jgi:hypothetical protein
MKLVLIIHALFLHNLHIFVVFGFGFLRLGLPICPTLALNLLCSPDWPHALSAALQAVPPNPANIFFLNVRT